MEQTKLSVSIITCTHNRPFLLSKAIKSIISQKYDNWEMVIVDNGTKSQTLAVVKKFRDKRVRYFHRDNNSIYDSTNFALSKITGDFFCFCDDDDILLSNKLSQQVSFLSKNPKVSACFSDFLVSRGKRIELISLKNRYKNFLFDFLEESLLANSCSLFRSKSVKSVRYNTKLLGTEATAYDWILRVASGRSIVYCEGKPVAKILRHDLNVSTLEHSMEEASSVLKKYYNLHKSRLDYGRQKILESNLLFREGKYYFWKHEYTKARSRFLSSTAKNPKNLKSVLFLLATFLKEERVDKLIPLYEKFTGRIYIKDCS